MQNLIDFSTENPMLSMMAILFIIGMAYSFIFEKGQTEKVDDECDEYDEYDEYDEEDDSYDEYSSDDEEYDDDAYESYEDESGRRFADAAEERKAAEERERGYEATGEFFDSF